MARLRTEEKACVMASLARICRACRKIFASGYDTTGAIHRRVWHRQDASAERALRGTEPRKGRRREPNHTDLMTVRGKQGPTALGGEVENIKGRLKSPPLRN